MPDVAHKDLTGSSLHEPKGVASAAAGTAYIANGTGSGSWTANIPVKGEAAAGAGQVLIADGAADSDWKDYPTGWGYYKDNGSAQTFSTTPVKLTIDGLFATTTEDYLPREIRGSGSLWNTTSNLITPIRLGDAYDLRLELTINAKTGSPGELHAEFDISGTASPATVIVSRYIDASRGVPWTHTIGFPLLALSAATVSNGVQIFLSTDTGTVDIINPAITLVRNHDGNF